MLSAASPIPSPTAVDDPKDNLVLRSEFFGGEYAAKTPEATDAIRLATRSGLVSVGARTDEVVACVASITGYDPVLARKLVLEDGSDRVSHAVALDRDKPDEPVEIRAGEETRVTIRLAAGVPRTLSLLEPA